MDALSSNHVAIATGHDAYPSRAPYLPSVSYPEYPFGSETQADEDNQAYAGVRSALRLLGLDSGNYDRSDWNPLGQIIQPGQTVVLKPNFVREFRETHAGHDDCLITHGSIIRAVLDYVYIALEGKGRIIIADAPHSDADFDAIRQMTGLDEIQAFYREHAGFNVEVCDLRPEKARKIDGVIVGHDPLPGDPAGYVKVNLGSKSMFAEIEHLCHLLYGSEYDTREICSHHRDGVHEYLISKTILDADCVINLPKLKTHKKTGLTVCMKNLVGINGNKNWLPHHRLGAPSEGGDQFADDGLIHRIERRAMACFRRVFPLLGPVRTVVAGPLKALGQAIFGNTNTDTVRSGNWYGNDTTWRMTIDLNRILLHFDGEGQAIGPRGRRILCLVDGIVAGEGNGPLDPTAKVAGTILAGLNPVAVELACARVMGFDYTKIPLLYRALQEGDRVPLAAFGYDEIHCASNAEEFNRPLADFQQPSGAFLPHFGWQGHIELAGTQTTQKT